MATTLSGKGRLDFTPGIPFPDPLDGPPPRVLLVYPSPLPAPQPEITLEGFVTASGTFQSHALVDIATEYPPAEGLMYGSMELSVSGILLTPEQATELNLPQRMGSLKIEFTGSAFGRLPE